MEDVVQRLFATFRMPRGGNFGAWVQIHLPRHLQYNQCVSHPLYYAARAGLNEVAKIILLMEGNSVVELQGGSRNSTPLHVASAFGHTKMVRLLLEQGANPNERNGDGERGIEWAAMHGYGNIVDILLQHGAHPLEVNYERTVGHSRLRVI
jgi:ankyrin repeat protein